MDLNRLNSKRLAKLALQLKRKRGRRDIETQEDHYGCGSVGRGLRLILQIGKEQKKNREL
jgi:hypothetical protein